MKKYHGCDLRKGRVSIPRQIYLVTTVTIKRQPIFNNLSNARFVINCLQCAERHCKAETLCFVIMPDHLHWLISLGNTTASSQIVADIKYKSAFSINQNNKQTGNAVWQPGFHDYALRKEEDIKGVARYIVANPLRAGLVDKIGDYPYWDAVWL